MSSDSNYEKLSDELQNKINTELFDGNGFKDNAIRRIDKEHDRATLWRPAFVRDVEKIMHSPYYNRYADKTQGFSFYKNEEISHRPQHDDLDLIEAVALGHDIGHTPFGHAGEKFLNKSYHANTGRYFNHNVHSVRVLDKIFNLNISLQTLDGILCHNGEFECKEYRPSKLDNFKDFDAKVEECYIDPSAIDRLVPSTLEGCVVRISDMIAYIGKDRQDAIKTKLIDSESVFAESEIGKYNAAIINNLIVNIVENSYGKDFIQLDEKHYQALKNSKKDNFRVIYQNSKISDVYDKTIEPMFEEIYNKLLYDLKNDIKSSPIFKHHIELIDYSNRFSGYEYTKNSDFNDIVTDYIASMTDDYFIDLYEYLFNKQAPVKYISYFDNV